VVGLAVLVLCSSCQALSPTQLWKLNRHPPMDRGDAYFSIPNDPLDASGSPVSNTRNSTVTEVTESAGA
jgi:hypothetical protein